MYLHLPPKILAKKFPAFYWNQKFINTFTSAHHWSLSSARWIQFTFAPCHPPIYSWSSEWSLSFRVSNQNVPMRYMPTNPNCGTSLMYIIKILTSMEACWVMPAITGVGTPARHTRQRSCRLNYSGDNVLKSVCMTRDHWNITENRNFQARFLLRIVHKNIHQDDYSRHAVELLDKVISR